MKDLVSFGSPPVVETVLAVGFAPLEQLTSPMFSGYWDDVREEFPTATEQHPYEMPLERLDVVARGNPISFQIGTPPIKTRLWLESSDGQSLIQLQRDWFALNWRKRKDGYVRYSAGRADFERLYKLFEKFSDDIGAGPIRPIQCEVTYINHIQLGEGRDNGAAAILEFLNPPDIESPLDHVETSQIAMSFLIDTDGEPIGRLHLALAEQLIGGVPTWVMNLTARGAPEGDGLAGIMKFFDHGREAIVSNFVAFTEDAMHREWELQ